MWIKDVEKVFELIFARLTVVQCQGNQGKQGPRARGCGAFKVTRQHGSTCSRTAEFAPAAAAAQINQHGEKNARQAVIHNDEVIEHDHAAKREDKQHGANGNVGGMWELALEDFFKNAGDRMLLLFAGARQRVNQRQQHD